MLGYLNCCKLLDASAVGPGKAIFRDTERTCGCSWRAAGCCVGYNLPGEGLCDRGCDARG